LPWQWDGQLARQCGGDHLSARPAAGPTGLLLGSSASCFAEGRGAPCVTEVAGCGPSRRTFRALEALSSVTEPDTPMECAEKVGCRMAGPRDRLVAAEPSALSREAVGALLHQHRRLITGVARRVAGPEVDLEDVVQDTMIAVASGLGRFRGECKVSTWIAGIAVRIAQTHGRRARRRGARQASWEQWPDPGGIAAEDPEGVVLRREFRAQLEQGIAQLAPPQRAVVVLRHVEGLSLAEVAQALRVPVGTVKSRLHHARRALQQIMRPYLVEEAGGE